MKQSGGTKGMTTAALRLYEAHAASTSMFGRVLATIREHAVIIDGPEHNGAPGEAPTPGELMLAAAAGCGAELLQVIARETSVTLHAVEVTVRGSIDRSAQPHAHVTVFTDVEFNIQLQGPRADEASELVAGFQRRCPVYGSLAISGGQIRVRHSTTADASAMQSN